MTPAEEKIHDLCHGYGNPATANKVYQDLKADGWSLSFVEVKIIIQKMVSKGWLLEVDTPVYIAVM